MRSSRGFKTTSRAALCLAAVVVCPPASAGNTLGIPFTLTKPAGDGPFPAVVILHDCSGLGPRSSGAPWRWSAELTAWTVGRAKGAKHTIVGYSGVFKPLAPLLILIGEADDWTPAEPCRRLAAASRQAGHPVDIVVYPGAHHSFDSPAPVRFVAERRNLNAASGRGATTGGQKEAWADAVTRVEGFLDRHLGERKK